MEEDTHAGLDYSSQSEHFIYRDIAESSRSQLSPETVFLMNNALWIFTRIIWTQKLISITLKHSNNLGNIVMFARIILKQFKLE